jgi:hypothetical protein
MSPHNNREPKDFSAVIIIGSLLLFIVVIASILFLPAPF